jgi:DNA helicase-2/ATP-dependent DNA helicase PcrA
MRIEVVFQTGSSNLPLVKLTGMLDRLDFDEGGNVVRVIDYKSGKPKTRGYIEGKTKNSNGDYKRQLVFYALLLSLYDDERFQCREGVLSFVEADAKGKIHEESYSITDDEVEELKREIIRVALEIASGAFLNTPCDPAKSEYCALVRELFGT